MRRSHIHFDFLSHPNLVDHVKHCPWAAKEQSNNFIAGVFLGQITPT
jgi:hypothetical protein